MDRHGTGDVSLIGSQKSGLVECVCNDKVTMNSMHTPSGGAPAALSSSKVPSQQRTSRMTHGVSSGCASLLLQQRRTAQGLHACLQPPHRDPCSGCDARAMQAWSWANHQVQ